MRHVYLPIDHLPFVCTSSAEESLTGAATTALQVTLRRACNGGLGMHENLWFAEILA